MAALPEIQQVSPTLALWHAFEPKVKADLFSTAISTRSGTFLIDPIPISRSTLDCFLRAHPPPAGIVVTNANHWRTASTLAEHLAVTLFARPSAGGDSQATAFEPVIPGNKLGDALDVIAIDGAANGEIALYDAANGGTLVIGDALINFEPYGFTFLPPKYCLNSKEMRRSLRQLLERPTERIFFAHGIPILNRASAQLRTLLQTDQ